MSWTERCRSWSHGRPTQRPADDRERSRTKVVHHFGYTASSSRSSPPNGAGKALFSQSVELSCFYDRLINVNALSIPLRFLLLCRRKQVNGLMQMLSNGTLACTVKCLILILRNYI